MTNRQVECDFKAFAFDPEVCDNCGRLASEHAPEYIPYREAVWKALISMGGIKSHYGGLDSFKTDELRSHFGLITKDSIRGKYSKSYMDKMFAKKNDCEIDWKQTADPAMGEVELFDGSFAPSQKVGAVLGYLFCKCGVYRYEQITLEELTLGQLIWHVVKAGEVA